MIDHYGETIVRGYYDGVFDKSNLPDELILTNYFTVRDGKIVSLIVIRNTTLLKVIAPNAGLRGR